MKLWEDRLNAAHNELVKREREFNSLKNNSVAIRAQMVDKEGRMREELKMMRGNKKNLETSLLGLRKQVEVMKFELDQLVAMNPDRLPGNSDSQKILKSTIHTVSKAKKKKKPKKDAKP